MSDHCLLLIPAATELDSRLGRSKSRLLIYNARKGLGEQQLKLQGYSLVLAVAVIGILLPLCALLGVTFVDT